MQEFEKILKDIQENLQGDYDQDMKYLNAMLEKYGEHKWNKDIVRGIGNMVYDILPEEEKAKVSEGIHVQIEEVNKLIAESRRCFEDGRLKEAGSILETLVAMTDGFFEEDTATIYLYFENYFQMYLYEYKYKPSKKVEQAQYNYVEIYYMYAYYMMQKGNYEKTIEYLEIVLEWNPVDAKTMLELAEVNKILNNWEEYLRYTKEALEVSVSSKDIARCYRNIGMYCIEKEQWDMAVNTYFFSNSYEKSEEALQAFMFIEEKTNNQIKPPTELELKENFKRNNIQMGGNELVMSVAYTLAVECENNQDTEGAKYCYEMLYDMTEDEFIKNKLNSLYK